jgi:hypothetical protein
MLTLAASDCAHPGARWGQRELTNSDKAGPGRTRQPGLRAEGRVSTSMRSWAVLLSSVSPSAEDGHHLVDLRFRVIRTSRHCRSRSIPLTMLTRRDTSTFDWPIWPVEHLTAPGGWLLGGRSAPPKPANCARVPACAFGLWAYRVASSPDECAPFSPSVHCPSPRAKLDATTGRKSKRAPAYSWLH